MKKIFLLLIGFALFVSCGDDGGGEVTPTTTIELKEAAVDIGNVKESTATAEFTASAPWTIRVNDTRAEPAWITVSPKEGGKGDAKITIKVIGINPLATDRKADITIKCGKVERIITVTQKQKLVTVDKSTISFGASDNATQTFSIDANLDWEIQPNSSQSWCTFSPTKGSAGITQIVVSATDAESRDRREVLLRVVSESSTRVVTVSQAGGFFNVEPTKPTLLRPAEGSTSVSVFPTFQWIESTDEDGDAIKYTVEYSTNSTLSSPSTIVSTVTTATPAQALAASTTYWYRIKADDNYGGIVYSDTYSFETDDKVKYQDGEYMLYQNNTMGSKPVTIVFTGDGYLEQDHIAGGDFDKHLNEGIEAFFSVEPYKSYRGYFRVYKIAAYSNQRGITGNTTLWPQWGERDTKFGCYLGGEAANSTNIKCDYDMVCTYAMKIPEITTEVNLTVVVVINADHYAGTCYMLSNGRSISMIPVRRGTQEIYSYKNTLMHEVGGHGFGRLGDEYTGSTMITDTKKSDFIRWSDRGYYQNLDITNVRETVKWKSFFSIIGYAAVGTYEGGFEFSKGVWRPEPGSCMMNNVLYFNAPSRKAIVDRIMTLSGGTFNMNDFVSKDKIKSMPTTMQTLGRIYDPAKFIPLGDPIMEEI